MAEVTNAQATFEALQAQTAAVQVNITEISNNLTTLLNASFESLQAQANTVQTQITNTQPGWMLVKVFSIFRNLSLFLLFPSFSFFFSFSSRLFALSSLFW